jgi:integrase/recombinase XerD
LLLSKVVEGFLIDRDGMKKDDLSPHTIALYRHCLAQLTSWLGDPDILSIQPADLNNYMTYLEKEYEPKRGGAERLSGYVQDNHWKAIRSCFGWASQVLSIPRPDLKLERPAVIQEEVQPVLEEEVKQILAACEYTKEAATHGRQTYRMHRPTANRDRAIILLFLETGIRLGELARLKIQDINLGSSELVIHPFHKGIKSKARTIPFGKGCRRALWLYREKYREDALDTEPFFALASHSIQSLMMRLEERTHIPGIHAHRFRHTFAIQYLRNGGDIFTLQRILGHSSLVMVQRYLAIAESDVKDAHRRASPVDRWRL